MINSATYNQQQGVIVYQETLPSCGRLLSQGVLSGALSSFLSVAFEIVFFPQGGYLDGILVGLLMFFLGAGAVFGFLTAVILWVITHFAERRLGAPVRLFVPAVLALVIGLLLSLPLSPDNLPTVSHAIPILTLVVVTVGLITGSDYRPGRALLRGMRT